MLILLVSSVIMYFIDYIVLFYMAMIEMINYVPTKYFVCFSTAFSSKLGYEEHIPGQTRDWNEELQTTRELPRKNLPERLLRERAIFKVLSKLFCL